MAGKVIRSYRIIVNPVPGIIMLALSFGLFAQNPVERSAIDSIDEQMGILVAEMVKDSLGWEYALYRYRQSGQMANRQAHMQKSLKAALDITIQSPVASNIIFTTILIRMAVMDGSPLPALKEALRQPDVPEALQYELAKAVGTIDRESKTLLTLLRSDQDRIREAAILLAGTSRDPEVLKILDEMLSNSNNYLATHTGEALAQLKVYRDYRQIGENNTDPGELVDFLLPRAGELYVFNPFSPVFVPSDELVAHWLWGKFRRLYEKDPEFLIGRIRQQLKEEPVNAPYLKQLLLDLPDKR